MERVVGRVEVMKNSEGEGGKKRKLGRERGKGESKRKRERNVGERYTHIHRIDFGRNRLKYQTYSDRKQGDKQMSKIEQKFNELITK